MQRLQEVSREGGVLTEDKDDLVAMEPAEPLTDVHRTQGAPELDEGGVGPVEGGGVQMRRSLALVR